MQTFREKLLAKIKTLNETVWEDQATEPKVQEWLGNFNTHHSESHDERLHALFLLSNFIFFGLREMRELLKAMYRDLYKYPIIQSIRVANSNTTDIAFISSEFDR